MQHVEEDDYSKLGQDHESSIPNTVIVSDEIISFYLYIKLTICYSISEIISEEVY